MPKVSVIIPTYNAANYLSETIESVLAQTYKDFEIIVIDDGSTDNTKEVVAPYLDRIMFLEVPNGGPAKARNRAIRESSGKYVAFLDADDIWYPDKLERQLTVFAENKHYSLVFSDASYTCTYTSNEDRTLFSIKKPANPGWIFSELLRDNFILVPSVIVKRECLEKVGLFDENLKWWEGYDLWLKIAFENQVGYVNAPLFYRRLHENNLFYSMPINEAICFIAVMKKWDHQDLKQAETDRKTINQRLIAGYNLLSVLYAAQGHSSEARQALKNSFTRGFSIKGIACLGVIIFPPVAVHCIFNIYKKLYFMFNKEGKV